MEYTPNLELEKLRTEKEQNEKKIEQLTHKITRLENRQKYLEDGERKRRTHRLCTIAGTLESIAPAIKELEITEVMELLEYVFHKEDVQQAVSRVKKAHDLRNRKAKEG
jgi:predicted nuclease with TOPRIM domain